MPPLNVGASCALTLPRQNPLFFDLTISLSKIAATVSARAS